jgi:hypothetical protein
MEAALMNLDWQDKTWAYNSLKSMSNVGDFGGTIIEWLKNVGVIPTEVKWRRAPMSIYNGLDGNAIKGRILAELAYEFDKEGYGTPAEYLEWLQYEIKGHPKRDGLLAVLATLGKRGPRVEG